MEVLSAVQSAISENEASDPNAIQNREGRGMEYYSPVIFWIGWIAVIYFGLYVATVFIGPALFGTRPYSPFYPGRNMRTRREAQANEGAANLAETVLSSIEKFLNKK